MVQVSYPGVYVQEERSGVHTITGVSTSIAAFVGMAARGEINVPTRVLSVGEFERIFSADVSQGELPFQVRQFFLNGGQEAYVVRVANSYQVASIDLQNAASAAVSVLRLTARSAGAQGNSLRVRIDYDTASPELTFNLTVYRETTNAAGALIASDLERHTDLTMDPLHTRNVEKVLAQASALITGQVLSTAPAADSASVLSGVLFADGAALDTAIADAITAAGGVGRFEVRLGNGPWEGIELNTGAGLTQLQAALTPKGIAVSIDATNGGALVLTDSLTGRELSVRRGVTGDIAQALQLGGALGGLDVGAYAAARPAATGSVWGGAVLGAAEVLVLASIDKADAAKVVLTGPGLSGSATVAYGKPDGTLGQALNTDVPTINQLRENLRAIVRAGSGISGKAKVELQGLRLVVTLNSLDPEGALKLTPALTAASDAFASNVSAYRVGPSPGTAGSQTNGVPGDDGKPPLLSDYNAAFDEMRRKVDLFNLLILPRSQKSDARPDVWGAASAFCAERRAFLLVDPDPNWTSRDKVSDGIESLRIGLVKDYSAVYWPGVKINDNGTKRDIDPAGTIAGVMARIDSNRGVWKAPAGTEADLRGVFGVQYPMSDADNGVLNPLAVNALRVFPGGIVSWGARTVDGFDNSGDDDYKYIPVRRLALYIEESLLRGLKFAVFEPNDEPLWRQIRLAGGAFMNNLFRRGAFQGQKATDAYFVKCDSETTTQNDINLGIVNVVVGFAPLKPAEFVVITLQQLAGQVQV